MSGRGAVLSAILWGGFVAATLDIGAAVLISGKSGHPLMAATMVAVVLGMVEAAQLFLPGRTAESTDPVLALILGLAIRLLSMRGKPT